MSGPQLEGLVDRLSGEEVREEFGESAGIEPRVWMQSARAARSRRCVLVGAHRPMISSAMEQRPPPLSAIFSDLDTTEVGRSAPRPANSGAAAKVLRID